MRAPASRFAILAATTAALAGGCATWSGPEQPAYVPAAVPAAERRAALAPPESAVVQAAHREVPPAKLPEPVPLAPPPRPAIEGQAALIAADVTRAVLERNPTLDQMRATAAAAAARYPQLVSLDDPTFGFSTAPGSIGSPNADYAARVEVAQKFLYPGKRALKGSAARAEALAAAEDVEDARLQLAEAAVAALADYYLAVKATAVAEENVKLLAEFHNNAQSRYKLGQGPQQDYLQAEVEIARQEERLVSLRRARAVAVARLNTLMHLPPDSPLPPPADAEPPAALPEATKLREAAQARPDLRALASRVGAAEAAMSLAAREYKPDVEVLAAYDGFWQGAGGRPLQWQFGVRTNLPVRYSRRAAAVDEARAKVAQRRAELARLTDQVNLQVQEAFEQLREADEVVRLYRSKALPAAEANVKEARAAYTNNKIPFLNLIEAQRNRASLQDRYYEATAEAARRKAALERAIGGPLPEK